MMSASEKRVPSSPDDENNVLGSILLGHDEALLQVCDWLKPEHFYIERNRHIYSAMLAVLSRNEPLDYISINNEIERRTGQVYLEISELIASTPTMYHIKSHAEEVVKTANCRKGIEIAANATAMFYQTPINVEGTIGQIVNKFLTVSDRVKRNSPRPSQIILELMGRDRTRVVHSSLEELNQLAGGVEPTHLWVVGGFSSTGKTAFALQLALDFLKEHKRVAYFSLEMSRHQLMLRLLGNRSSVPIWKIDKELLSEAEHDRVAEAQDWYGRQDDRLWMYDDCYDLAEIEYLCRKHKMQSGLDIVFIDFLQNLRGGDSEYERLSDAAKSIQQLAKQLDCCVFALSQISNEQAREGMGTGDAYSFKGSGAIRDAADKAWVLTRDRDADADRDIGHLKAILKKNRQGPIGEVKLRFQFATGRIYQE